MDDDIFTELQQLFAQVDIRAWTPLLEEEGLTPQTRCVAVMESEARALLDAHRRFIRHGVCELGEELGPLVDRVQSAMQTITADSENVSSRFFVKLNDFSPKDRQASELDFQASLASMTETQPRTQAAIQALAFSRSRALAVCGAEESLLGLVRSSRIAEELERKLELGGEFDGVDVVVREFIEEFSPEFEFRCFVHQGRITGASAMATMDLVVHYPEVVRRREELRVGLLEFWKDKVAGKVWEMIRERGPADSVVVDLMYLSHSKQWMVVEFNPFITSSAGHLFQFTGRDLQVLQGEGGEGGECELRVVTTPNSSIPDEVLATLSSEEKEMVMRVVEEDDGGEGGGGEGAAGGGGGGGGRGERNAGVWCVVVGGGRPEWSVDLNKREVEEWVEKTKKELGEVVGKDRVVGCAGGSAEEFIKLLREVPEDDVSDVVVLFAGHGNVDFEDDDETHFEPITVRGVETFARPQLKGSQRFWIDFPKPSTSPLLTVPPLLDYPQATKFDSSSGLRDATSHALHWPILARELVRLCLGPDLSGKRGVRRVSCGILACYSGAAFRWLPTMIPSAPATPLLQSELEVLFHPSPVPKTLATSLTTTLPIQALTSSDNHIAVSTWLWQQLMSHLLPPPSPTSTSLAISLQHLNPESSADPEQRGEPIDAAVVTSFATPLSLHSNLPFLPLPPPSTSSGGAQVEVTVDGEVVRVEERVLLEQGLRKWVEETSDGKVVKEGKGAEQVLAFAIAQADGKSWEPRGLQWQEIVEYALIEGLEELSAALIAWRENETRGDGGKELGDADAAVQVGWDDGVVGLSIEVEGGSSAIVQYYRTEDVSEEEWKAMSVEERLRKVGGNWTQLKRKLTGKSPRWFNRSLTIEDAGFLWEVSFGGESPGWSVDPQYMARTVQEVSDLGLGVADRAMDSAIQAHISFPFSPATPPLIRDSLVLLTTALSDWLFLQCFERVVVDDCNNLWTSEDIHEARTAACATPPSLASLISPGAPDHRYPAPRFKHKVVAIRGPDVYGEGRLGWELRRGYDSSLLCTLLTSLPTLLSTLTPDSTLPLISFTSFTSSFLDPDSRGWKVSEMGEWVASSRCVPERGVTEDVEDRVAEAIALVGAPWIARIVEWEIHLRRWKARIWGGEEVGEVEEEFHTEAKKKVVRRISFLLFSNWSTFPCHPSLHTLRTAVQTEALHIKSHLANPIDDTQAQQIRNAIIDLAGSIARMY